MKLSIVAAALTLFFAPFLTASVIVSVQSATVTPGASGVLDVRLTNTGPASFTVEAFTFAVFVLGTDVTFLGANGAGNDYLFAGHSLFGPDLTVQNTGQMLLAADLYATPSAGTTVGSGQSFSLGQVLFTVGTSSGIVPVFLQDNPGTSLADTLGNDIHIDTLLNGSISISDATVPEPRCSLPLLAALTLVWLRRVRRS
jgi:hypothetical protein